MRPNANRFAKLVLLTGTLGLSHPLDAWKMAGTNAGRVSFAAPVPETRCGNAFLSQN